MWFHHKSNVLFCSGCWSEEHSYSRRSWEGYRRDMEELENDKDEDKEEREYNDSDWEPLCVCLCVYEHERGLFTDVCWVKLYVLLSKVNVCSSPCVCVLVWVALACALVRWVIYYLRCFAIDVKIVWRENGDILSLCKCGVLCVVSYVCSVCTFPTSKGWKTKYL